MCQAILLFVSLLCIQLGYINGALLGETCASDSDCIASFSLCTLQKCTCIKGFTQDGSDKCIPTTMQCPHIGLVANPQKCLTNADLSNGSCPDGFYCLVHEQAAFGAGHCCPAPQLLCPAGLPDPVSSCAKGAANRCDVSTHFCNGLSLGTYNNDAIIQVCCKKPCVSDEFYNEGKCYKTKDFGQTCEIDQQCKVKNSVCKNGVCACPEGKTLNFNPQMYIWFCSEFTHMAAPTPEVEEESDPSIRLFLNENCSLSDSSRMCAASFSLCVNGTCKCAIGFIPDGNATCKPQSFSCPFVQTAISPLMCTRKENPVQLYGSIGYIDTCPTDHQCLTHTGENIGSGHCCPVEPLFCPVGSPDLSYNSGKCDMIANLPECRNASHMCVSTFLNDQRYGQTCCPNPCPKRHILRNNKCLPTERQEGESCELNEQCMFQGECQNGTCQCSKTYYNHKVYKLCTEAICPHLKPLARPDGDLLRCKTDSQKCPNATFCDFEGEFCCPIPEQRCDSIGVVSDKLKSCDPENDNPCDNEHQYCKALYTELITENGRRIQKRNGICCSNED